MEPEPDDRLGLGYHQFRVVGRYRSCGYADLRDPAPVPPGMAYGGEPCGRGDDHLCGNVRGSVPDLAYGSGLDGFFRDALPQYARPVVGEFQLSFVMGRICSRYLLYSIPVILVYGVAARSRHR